MALTEADIRVLLDALGYCLGPSHPVEPGEWAMRVAELQQCLIAERFDEGAERAANLLEQDPLSRPCLLAMAHCLHGLGEFQQALGFYMAAQLLDPADAACVCHIGECLAGLGYPVDAQEAFETAIEISWADPSQDETRAWAQRRLQQWDDKSGQGGS
jgi:tetratricopeptide (TPR) repeat protein